jgi:two-component system NtrC family sensor kinase
MGPRHLGQKFLDQPLRVKFILSIMAVIVFGGVLSLFFGTRLEHRTIFDLAQAKVGHDLSAAWMVYNEKLNDIRDIVRLNSGRETVEQALGRKDRQTLEASLVRVRAEFGLDILTLTDDQGRVVLRLRNPAVFGDDQSKDPLVRRALQRATVVGTEVVPRSELLLEGEDLARRAELAIKPTPKAAPRHELREVDGLMLKAAAPVVGRDGTLLGVLVGGILLNRNYDIVDRVKDIVYKGERYKGKEIGTVTIFQNDLRISTNVTDESGERAIGTRVSREVYQTVLEEGKPWMGRAFVVSHWYITAYEPIRNLDGRIVGMLYVGMLEKPYIDLRNRVMLTFTGLAVLCTILLLALLALIITSMIKPLRRMVAATQRIAQGDLDHKVIPQAQDEIGQLALSFNRMTDKLKEANEGLWQWTRTLEKRVEERTEELGKMQDFMVQSEKLASLGKMAAGVAHEINNPLTSILLNTHLMLEKVEPSSPFFENLTLIADETTRCSHIVRGLLEFARQNPPQKVQTDINALVDKIVQLLENQAAFQNIVIIRQLAEDLPPLSLDRTKIQQVIWNLMINAAEAMAKGGTLMIVSRLADGGRWIELLFVDTGPGIAKEILNKLFDPFFSTKSSGLGLGLAVCYGIIQGHQGSITVESEPGHGATFTIRLPVEEQARF